MAVVRQLTNAWVRKDWLGMSRCLTEDIFEVGPAFPAPILGKDVFFRKYKGYLTSPKVILSYRILRPRSLALSKRLAMVSFSYRMRTRTDRLVEESKGKESMLLERRPSGWLVKFIHWHCDPE